ncbi:MAG TPA: hypothetical protein VJ813_06745 [Vicinamibacterales bacterium]|nr:hypothetical protein [Vicinamibacterales bacterium]
MLLVFPGALAVRTGPIAATGGPDPTRPLRLIAALDACIQERFKEINERFGMSRVMRIDQTPHAFRPEQASELAAVTALQQANLRVVLYLAGRRVQAPKPDTSRWSEAEAWRLIKGPVAITPSPATPGIVTSGVPPAPPPPLELWDESRRAMQAFTTSDSHEFDVAAWRFVARPVRASSTTCLGCHAGASRPVRLGDALGAVLYGYQPR